MLKSCEDISSTKKRLTIEIPADAIEAEIQKGLLEARMKTKIPGFRPGKAPINIIEKKFGKSVEAEAVEKLVPQTYMEAVKEADIKPVSPPTIEEESEFSRNQPLSLTVSVDVRPVIEDLDYENISVKDIPVEVQDDEVEVVVRRLAEEKGTYEAVEDAVASGDLVTVDYTTEDGVEKKDTVIRVGSGPYPKEFFDALLGKKKDEEFSAEVSFPEDSPTEFAGKTPKFAVKVKDIKRRNVPAVDDELAKDMGLENLQAVREMVKNDIITMKNVEADRKKQIEIIEKLLATYPFEAPEGMVNAELERLIEDVKASGQQGTDDELAKEYRPRAEKNARVTILLDIIGEKEGITVSEDEIKEEVINFSRRYHVSPEHVIKYYVAKDGSLEGLRNAILDRKTMKALLAKAKIEKE